MNTLPDIQTHPKNDCYLCGHQGQSLYTNLSDRLFGVKGHWNLDKCTNSDCQLVWLNPMPNTDDLPKLYEDYYTHAPPKKNASNTIQNFIQNSTKAYTLRKYNYPPQKLSLFSKIASYLISLNPALTANLDFSTFYLPYTKKGRILEIGCGNGQMLQTMETLGWDATGIDFDPKSIETAKALGLDVRQGDISKQQFPPESFDAIVMSHVIEHLPDSAETLSICNSLLRPGGKLIAITPNTTGFIHNRFKQNNLHLDPPRHLYLFNRNSLKTVARKAGFKQTSCHSTIRDFAGLWKASLHIQNTDRHQMKPAPAPLYQKIKVLLLAIFAGYALKLNLLQGDELVLEATK